MDEPRHTLSRREFLPTAALLGGSLLQADQKTALASERKSATLSKEASAVIKEVAARNAHLPASDEENIRRHLRECDVITQACRSQKLHKIEFRGNLFYANSNLLKYYPGEPMIPWIDGFKEAGFTGVDINMGLFPWYNQDRANIDKIERAVERIRYHGLRLASNPELDPAGQGTRLPDWEAYTQAAVKIWPMLAKRYQPVVLMLTHEPSTLSARMGFPVTLEQWTDFVKRTAAAVKEASPKTAVGVGFIPVFQAEMKFAEKWVAMPEFDLISVDVYSFAGLDRVDQVVAAAKAAGKRVFIEETWRGVYWTKEIEKKYPGRMDTWGGASIALEAYQPVDAKWIEMVSVYAAAWGMDAVVPFYTQTFFKYDPINGWVYDGGYNKALQKALFAGERTKTFYAMKKTIQELGKTRDELA
jgi:hypothetical protein